jgi:hypothetical protein
MHQQARHEQLLNQQGQPGDDIAGIEYADVLN